MNGSRGGWRIFLPGPYGALRDAGYRFIPLDGRPHVGKDVKLWNGDSRGRWEGDSLVIDVTNFKEGPCAI